MVLQVSRRLFSVQEYHRMLDSEILTERDRVELIRGEIIRMSPIGRRHAACVNRLNDLLQKKLGIRALVSIQNPVELDDNSEPQPDVVLLRRKNDYYESGHPQAEDILLLIEVADTTVESDREIKIPTYAGYGIVEVWLANSVVEGNSSRLGYAASRIGMGCSLSTSANNSCICVASRRRLCTNSGWNFLGECTAREAEQTCE
jgi:Uma2 family endonuclease